MLQRSIVASAYLSFDVYPWLVRKGMTREDDSVAASSQIGFFVNLKPDT